MTESEAGPLSVTVGYCDFGEHGRGWWYWETEYPDEHKCGPFGSHQEASGRARADLEPHGHTLAVDVQKRVLGRLRNGALVTDGGSSE